MDLWMRIIVTLGLVSWAALGSGLIYWIKRAKRTESEREELRDELQGVASLLSQYRSSSSGITKDVLSEIADRLSITSPRFTGFLRPRDRQEEG